MYVNTKEPSKMTNEDRLQEVALILSECLIRINNNKQKQGIKRSLTGLPTASKRSCTHNKNSKKRLESEVKTCN